MEQRYIDSLTEICGKANVFYEMADIERYLYDETEEYVRPKACDRNGRWQHRRSDSC